MASSTLTLPQLRALFNILVHYETYAEVEGFKDPEAITKYGYPFTPEGSQPIKSSSPLLQLLLVRVILPIPGFKDVPLAFWRTQFRGIMMRLGDADLSESYDKGTLGTRKRLATAASVLHESVTRGLLAGVACDQLPDLQKEYDTKTAEGLTQAWDDSIAHLVHGNLADELFRKAVGTKDFFEVHSPAVAAAMEYAIIHIAALLHFIFVLSPEGPYILKLLESIHSMIPYSVIAQTFRIGNAATMINGMVKLFLAKVSVGAVTNWFGITRDAADGMNLLQRIISMTLDWDASDFRKTADKIKKSKERASDGHFAAIDQHVQASREEHEAVRETSIREEKSVVMVIFESKGDQLSKSLSETQHAQCLEYYSAQLAIRDREKIIDATCRQNPDYMTSMVKEGLSAFDPMIRTIHSRTDLRKHIFTYEKFMNDFIKTAKGASSGSDGKKGKGSKLNPPTVEDFVAMLNRNRDLPFEYLHDVARGCPDIRSMWCDWAREGIQVFRAQGKNGTTSSSGAKVVPEPSRDVGKMTADMQRLFDEIPPGDRDAALEALDSHAKYMMKVEAVSQERMQGIISSQPNGQTNPPSTGDGHMSGPGVYLSSWQSLLNKTLITPETPKGSPRHGKDVKSQKAAGKTDAVSSSQDSWDPSALLEKEDRALPEAPDVSIIVDHLELKFRNMVADIVAEGLSESCPS